MSDPLRQVWQTALIGASLAVGLQLVGGCQREMNTRKSEARNMEGDKFECKQLYKIPPVWRCGFSRHPLKVYVTTNEYQIRRGK